MAALVEVLVVEAQVAVEGVKYIVTFSIWFRSQCRRSFMTSTCPAERWNIEVILMRTVTRVGISLCLVGSLLALPALARFGTGGSSEPTGQWLQQSAQQESSANRQGIPQNRGQAPAYRAMQERGYSLNADGHIIDKSGIVLRDAAGAPVLPRSGFLRQQQ